MYKKTTLKNGLRIITVPMKNTQATTVLLLVGTGSKYETKDINGISHFLEHMLGKGTKKWPDPFKLADVLDKVGGAHNAFTGNEYTGYWAKVDFKHLDLALDWSADKFLNSLIQEKEINKERGVIIEEINMYLDAPMMYVSDLWEKLLYGNQPAGWPIIGEKENILNFKREHFLDYLKNYYTAKNTIICCAGNINSNSTEDKIKKYFKNIKIAPLKPKLKTIERQTRPECLIHFKKTDQTHLILGVRAYDLFHPLKYAQAILAAILGGFMSSRLFMSVREEKGLAYYIRTSSDSATDTGCLLTSAGVRNEKTGEAIRLILKEYKAIRDKGISEREFQKAKDYLKGSLTLSLESSDAQAVFYTGQELLTNKILTLQEQIKKIDEARRDDILKVARDIFQPQKLNLALIGPFKHKIKFQQLLKL